MRNALVILLIPHILLGCISEDKSRPEEAYGPHIATTYRLTPVGHLVDSDEKKSVSEGWTTNDDIDVAVDLGFDKFYAAFPEFSYIDPKVSLTDDYCFWWESTFTADQSFGVGSQVIFVALWMRRESGIDPGPHWIVRAPGTYFGIFYKNWRYTDKPLVPALAHSLLHCAIGDPNHLDSRWARLR